MPSALVFQLLISPALNGASLREYPALAGAFLRGFRQGARRELRVRGGR
jgi:hypothetical protein